MKNKIILLSLSFIVLIPGFVLAEELLTLEASIEIAIKNSVIIHSAREGVKAATAYKQEAVTGFLPRFNTSYNYTRLSEAPFMRLPAPLPPEVKAGTRNNYNWAIEATQPVFTGGALVANYQASKIGEAAARMEETARIQDVVQDVKIAYFDVLRTQEIKGTAEQSVAMLVAHRDVARNYFDVGMIPKNDLLHAEVELANGRQALIKAQNALEFTGSRFNTILKRRLSEPVRIAGLLQYVPFEKKMDECLKTAAENRPELKVAILKAEQAGKLVQAARSEYLPTLSLVGNYTRFGDNPSVSGSDYKDAENWYIMGVANWNFWEWGKTKFRVEANRAKENQALDAAKELNDQIALEIKNAYLLLQEAETQIAVSEKVIEQAEENFRIASERFKERVATSTDVLDAQTLLTRARAEYANSLADYNISCAKLERAMGVLRR